MSVLIGRRAGRLRVVEAIRFKGEQYVTVRCDCGTEKTIRYENMRSRRTLSCGCLRRERGQRRGPELAAAMNRKREANALRTE